LFTEHAGSTLRKLDADPSATLDPGEVIALEAVIRMDGTRPTLLIKNDTIDPEHPMAGSWRDTLYATLQDLPERAAAVGRIEPERGSSHRFFGTGWLVDDAKGLVLTNRHVLCEMLEAMPDAMIRAGEIYRVNPDRAFIDFAAESGSLVKRKFRIVEATPSSIGGPMFVRLDAAVLRIEPVDQEDKMPKAIPVIADTNGPTGAMSSFCVIGYPGHPQFSGGVVGGVDWNWITQTLFGNRFGVKRLAPGNTNRPLGAIPDDTKGWAFGHDATTLGGSSGSPVLAWRDRGFPAFGLHFAGTTESTNCAHAIAKCRDELLKMGVPIRGSA
jgi:hypothetical protein